MRGSWQSCIPSLVGMVKQYLIFKGMVTDLCTFSSIVFLEGERGRGLISNLFSFYDGGVGDNIIIVDGGEGRMEEKVGGGEEKMERRRSRGRGS